MALLSLLSSSSAFREYLTPSTSTVIGLDRLCKNEKQVDYCPQLVIDSHLLMLSRLPLHFEGRGEGIKAGCGRNLPVASIRRPRSRLTYKCRLLKRKCNEICSLTSLVCRGIIRAVSVYVRSGKGVE
jgi:hypothetical protein